MLSAVAAASAGTAAAATDPCSAPANPIVAENCQPGTPQSQWDVVGAGDRTIQGFATEFSVNRGTTEHFKVNTDASAYTIDIYRIGYYGGDGARLVATVLPSTSPQAQPACLNDSATGLNDCGNWAESASWAVPASAVSGVYFAKLTRTDTNGASQIPFVVRDDTSHSALLYQTSDTTWQAYNDYGGNSLYSGGPGTNPDRAFKVSYNRPFATRGDSPEDFFFNAEYPMVRWLEANGFDTSYISGIDTDRGGAAMLEQHNVFMSVGHDEYWSGNQRANVEAARDAGVNLAFLSGNQVFWKTRWETSIDAGHTAYRTLVSYKETHAGAKIDANPAWTGTWRDPLGATYDAGRPENALAGTIFMVNSGTYAIQVPASDAGLRLWRNTRVASLESGSATLAADTLGYEWNEDLDNGARPPGEIDLSSTTQSVPELLQDAGSTYAPGSATHSITLHRAASGALVFDVGTIQWSWGLDGNHDRGASTPDSAMQQATVNVFADMGAQPATLQSGLVATTASTDASPPTSVVTSPAPGDTVVAGSPLTVTGTASDAGGGHVAGVEVSTDDGATWHPATGHESWSYTFTPVTAGPLSIKSRATDDSVNTGPASSAVAITVAPHGCPCSLWSNSTTPAGVGFNDHQGGIDYGVKFRSDAAGVVSGFRFYKSPAETGTHVGHLWTTDGTQLASATFTNETASGWQQVALSSPISIAANTTYIASIFSSDGIYPDNQNFFGASGVDNPPLHALQSGVDGPNAVYHESATDAFPDQSFNASNYWADVVFSSGPDTTPPVITSRSPVSGATGVPALRPVTATFNEAMDASTISATSIDVRDASNVAVPATVSYDASTFTATLTPSTPLSPAAHYTARVDRTVTDVAGNPLGADVSWSFTTAAAPPDTGPGGPILVIGSTANPFGRYIGEILNNEGLNEYRSTDITNVTPAVLANYDVAILGDMTLTATQASALNNWVSGGGKLIAMRPDTKLSGVLGVTKTPGTMSNAYMKIDTTRSPGQGLTDQTVQYHGSADEYQLNGAASLATLYSDATTASTFPALTLADVGTSGGQAAAFSYDLARSVVYTREGNPAWSGQERDGVAPIRSDDLFFGASASDPQPDWVNLGKVAIPQADEQQRLLANLIIQMDANQKPLPRFWYMPRGAKAVVVMTGDDHGNGGTAGRFDEEIGDSPAGCNVANWECVRSTSYIYTATPLTDAQAASYASQGFEIGVHVTTDCADWTPASLANFYASQLADWRAKYSSLPGPYTNRTHCIPESDYSTQPHVELANGVRLDTNYYYWPPSWIQDRPGMFTGSGMPMRFADADGSAIDVYQAPTQMTDESGQTYPFTVDTLLDNALGPLGYYGVFTANMHNDSASSSGADAIIASAQARGVPIVSARQMLDWLDGRNGSSFGALTWNNDVLSFTVNHATTANGLQAMLPAVSADGSPITSITRGGSSVPFTTATIKGITYAQFDAAGGSYTATYTPDTTPPVISGASSTATSAGDATVTWTTDEAATSNVTYGTAPDALNITVGDPSRATSHSISLHGLTRGTKYYYRVSSTDRAGNTATSPPPSTPLSFTVPTFVATDTTAANYASGTVGTCATVAHTGDGELELAPTAGSEFSGTSLPGDFFSTPWAAGGTAAVTGGQLVLQGARAGTSATFAAGRSLEFVATFANESFQHVGFGTDFAGGPWAIFSTGPDGTSLKARTNDGGSGSTDTTLPGNLTGSPHRFRIDWSSSQVVYWVDGMKVATHSATIGAQLRPLASDAQSNATNLSVDWMQMTPFTASCMYVSRAVDAAHSIGWLTLEAATTTPANTGVTFETRTSNDAATWSPFAPVTGTKVSSPAGRYLQYRASLSTTDPATTPLVNSVKLTADDLPTAPFGVHAVPANGAASVSWAAAGNNGSPVASYIVTPYKAGVAQAPVTFNSTATTETVGALMNGTSYTFTVAAKNGIGTGPPSSASPAIIVGTPIAPTNVTAKAGTGNATVSWSAPGSDNGSPISGYVITPYVGLAAEPPRRYDSTALQQTVSGLQKGTSYRFTVAAINGRGTGPESPASSAVSPK